MATRGKKPKPTKLHVVDGTYRSDRHANRDGEPESPDAPVRPAKLTKREGEIWDDMVATAHWLGVHDTSKAHAWTCMTARLEKTKYDAQASIFAQWRVLGSELGFDIGARTRLGGLSGPKVKNNFDKFFDD